MKKGLTVGDEKYRNTHMLSFDSTSCQETSVTDLDMKIVTRFFREKRVQQQPEFQRHMDDQKLLEQFNFLQGSSLTYGALLCFGKNPSHWVEGTGISCIYWRGKNREAGWIEEKPFEGSLLEQFESSMDFLKKNVPLRRTIDPTGRSEQWEIPFIALQEALVNAILHREYANQPNIIKVELFEDRLEITSPGGLPDPLTLRDLSEEGRSELRNPQIARIFYLSNYVERVGSGIPRMKNAMKRAGLPAPDFTKGSPGRFKVVLLRHKPKPVFTSLSTIVRSIDSKRGYQILLLITLLVALLFWLYSATFYFRQLGGVDLNRYCESLGYHEHNADVSCFSNLKMDAVCNWQYETTGLSFQLQNPIEPTSGNCYDSQGNLKGGIRDMDGYCKDSHHDYLGMPEAMAMGNEWVCEQKINVTLVCLWQFNRTDVQARKNDQGSWQCYSHF